MTSEITAKPTLAQKEWLARKGRIGIKIGEIVEFSRKSIMEILPDIRAIKEKKLWERGGYSSFKEFCRKGIGVTQQHIYKSLADDEEARKVLVINGGESSHLTLGGEDEPLEQETKYEPPADKEKKKGGRKRKPEPEPVEAEFTEATPAPIRGQDTSLYIASDGDPLAETLPPAANAAEPLAESTPNNGTNFCPHCGQAIPTRP
jgi:hypothetical protein